LRVASHIFFPAKFHNFTISGLFFIHKNKRVQFFMKHRVWWSHLRADCLRLGSAQDQKLAYKYGPSLSCYAWKNLLIPTGIYHCYCFFVYWFLFL